MLLFRYRNLLLLVIALMALALVAVACGGDDATQAPAATTAPAATAAPTVAAAPTAVPSGPQPTPTTATGAFRATPTPASAAVSSPTAAPTEEPAMMTGEAKVETLVISVDPSAGETNLPWAGTVDHHQQMDLVMEVLVDIEPTNQRLGPRAGQVLATQR